MFEKVKQYLQKFGLGGRLQAARGGELKGRAQNKTAEGARL